MLPAERSAASVLDGEDLVRRIHANDASAFDELYARYSPRVFGYLVKRLRGDAQEAEDLTADVFTRVYQKIDAFEPQGAPLSAWVLRIAHNRLIDAVRQRSRFSEVALDVAPELASAAVFNGVEQRLTLEAMETRLACLTAEQRQVVMLRFIEGRSLAETAAVVGRNVEAVKKLQARGLASLRRQMECLSGCWRMEFEHAG